ncbi:MAG: LPS export ABC transporter periplasmic protein LptC [Natronospirillum sp.]|uniref:LPS export ABC transporter periplasmic protein LptC n=1 Tax=Natronospirillum sp. TaxID=2812955 RepID=UPI0025EF8E04|nr:LPS export ABC transporter periplasmic protein LptC [Natronospirillum sp.]MCH8552253.1 LPS export ABC transporter periplasmic protein LptC [Natronospirillum sp.]
MRRWLALAAAVIAVGVGVLLLQWQDRQPIPETVETTEEAPQLVMSALRRVTTNTSGEWQSTLLADEARYFEAADRLDLLNPHLWRRSEDDDQEIIARRATLLDGTHWTLLDDVVVISNPDTPQPSMIHTDFLEYDTITDIATTALPVRLEQTGRLYTTAIGMTLNLSTQEFDLHEAVRTRLYPETQAQ